MTKILRLRKQLDASLPPPIWPPGIAPASLPLADPAALHAILFDAYRTGFGDIADFADWWPQLLTDPEFDRDLLIVAVTPDARPVGLVQCWTSAFVKDIAVRPDWRGKGIARALLLTAFHRFQLSGADSVDLKVVADNHAALKLYHSLGMVEAPPGGA